MIRAVVMTIKKDGKVLFVKRADYRRSLPGRWSLPAERIINDEPVSEAAERCAWHELGIKIGKPEILHEYHFKDEHEDKILYFVSADVLSGEAAIQHDEVTELMWVSMAEFFRKFKDEEIGHGLQYLRKNAHIWIDI